LLLHRLFLEELSISRLGVVDAALGLVLALPASCSLVLSGSYWLCRVPITDTLVALVEKVVVWDVVGVDVFLDLGKVPVGERVDLDEAGLVDLDDVQVSTLATLATSATSQDSLDLEFRVGTLSRLHLGNVVVKFVVGVPQLVAMLGSKVVDVVAASRLVDVYRCSVSPPYPVNKGIGFVEVVESV